MIIIEFTPTSLSVTGHARAAPYGQDIVCAGISTLVQTLAVSAEALATDDLNVSLEPGEAFISWAREPTKELSLLIDSFALGCSLMADSYPDYIQITCTR